MHEPMQNPYPPNVQANLARERNRIAADRSLAVVCPQQPDL
jgi:hypothetical protein